MPYRERKGGDPRLKIKEYLKEDRRTLKWFSEQIGMNYQYIYQIITNSREFPKKYWKLIINVTKGYVTLEDLAELDREEGENEENIKENKENNE